MPPRESPPSPGQLSEHVEAVRRLARTLVSDHATAEDVAQEALLQAVEQPPKPGWGLAAWLRGVVRNKARERRRAERRRVMRERAQRDPAAVPSAGDMAANVELHKRVLDAVLALPDPYRTVVWLRYFEQRSARSIARLLSVPTETVRTQLRRGLDRLRAVLDAGDRPGFTPWAIAMLPWLDLRGAGLGEAVLEGLSVSIKSKTAVALACVAVLLGTTWLLHPWDRASEGERAHGSSSTGGGPAAKPDEEGPVLLGSASASASGQPAAPPPVDLSQVDRQRDLHGVVVRTDGTPVAGARLLALRRPWERDGLFNLRQDVERLGERISATDGTFALRLTPGAVVDLEVSAPGLATVLLSGLNAGERVRAVLPEGVTLYVEVQTEAAQPVAACPVRVLSAGRSTGTTDVRLDAVTGPLGVVAFAGLPGGLKVYLHVKSADVGSRGWIEVELPSKGEMRHLVVVLTGRTLAGTVLDAETRLPLAGALVGSGWTAAHAVKTDAAGAFTFQGWTGSGSSQLTAVADGYVRVGQPVGENTRFEFALARGARVSGRVLNTKGAPIEGALVAGNAASGDPKERTMAFPTIGTDAAGGFVLDGVLRTRDLQLAVQAEGSGGWSEVIPAARFESGALDLGDIILGDDRWLRGVVVDAEGAPVPRHIVFLATGKERHVPGRYGLARDRFTDDLGRFAFRGLVPGPYRVVVRPTAQNEVMALATVPEEGEADALRLVIPDARRIEVEVVTTEGKPVEGLIVHVQGGTQGYVSDTQTDARGRATILCTADVRYVALGFPTGAYDRYSSDASTIYELRPDDRSVRFVLYECEVATGRVADEQGLPVPGATFDVLMPDGRKVASRAGDAEGRFRCPIPMGLVARLVLSGSAEKQMGQGVSVVGLAVEGELGGVRGGASDLVLKARALAMDRNLSLSVVLPDGSPVFGAMVHATYRQSSVDGMTDAAGFVQLKGVPDRPLDVRIIFSGRTGPGELPLAPTRLRDVQPGDTIHRITLQRSVRLMGRVVDDQGRAVPGVKVQARFTGWERPSTSSAPDGQFAFFLHPTDAFPLDLEVAHVTATGSLLTAQVRVMSGDEAPTLVLRRAATATR